MRLRRSGMTAAIEGAVRPVSKQMAARLAPRNWLLVFLTVAAGLLVARFVLTCPIYYVAAGSLALLLGLLLVRNLQFGVLGYFFVAALAFGESPAIQSPHSGYRAGLMPSQVFLAFLALLWLGRAAFADGFRLVKSELNLPLAALAVVSLASLVTSNVLHGTRELLFHQMLITQVAEVGLLGFSICAFFLAANTLREQKWIGRLFAPVVLLGLYFAAHRIFGFDFPIPMIWGSFLLAAAIAFVYARLLFQKLGRARAVGLALLLLIMLYAAYRNLSWVSGWVAVTGAILTVSYCRSRPLAALLVVLTLTALFVYPGIYHSVQEESEIGGDFDRFIIWGDAFRMFTAVNPVLGVGPGNYHAYVYYHSTLWFGGQTYTTAHSNYVQMAAELGLVGLAVLLWIVVSAIRAGSRAGRSAPTEMRWLPVAATSIFAAMAVASLFGDYLFPSRGNNGIVTFGTTVYTWLIMGTAVAAGNLQREPVPDGAE